MDDDAAGPARPLRQGEAWSEREHEQLVHAVADGEPVVGFAAQLQRTRSAVTAQLRRLVPAEVPVSSSDRLPWLGHC